MKGKKRDDGGRRDLAERLAKLRAGETIALGDNLDRMFALLHAAKLRRSGAVAWKLKTWCSLLDGKFRGVASL